MQRSKFGSLTAALAALLLAACGGGQSESSPPPPPPSNTAPTANAGSNQTVTSGAIVTLNGTASSDADGSIAGYTWSQTAGTTVTLTGATTSQPTFTAPSVATAATLTFSLVVSDNRGAGSSAVTVNVVVNPAASGNLVGQIHFVRIPTTTSNGLNFGSPQLQAARGVLVRAVTAGTQTVLASSTTDAAGNYAMTLASGLNVNVVVVAQMQQGSATSLPRWDFRTEDLDATTPTPYTYTDGQSVATGSAVTHDIDIPSGISASGTYSATRPSAPFAVLDTVYKAVQLVLTVAPTTDFPPLILDWATNNPGSQTFFDPGSPQHIVLSADPAEDTDEFDEHVIAHEFGHYIENNFSRADNIGGSHGIGDKLDIRTAFGEGFGYAFGAIVLNDPVTRDTFVNASQQVTSTFNVETNPPSNPVGAQNGDFGCWCSESSTWSILWDLYDSAADANDNVALGFQPMWDVLIGAEKNTHAFTSIFSFTDALKRANAGSAAAINTLLAAQNISSVQDEYGTGETHTPTPVNSSAALPVYTDITVGGGAKMLLNVNDAGHYNTLGNHRFLKFTLNATRSITITVSTSNAAADADPDFLVYRNGAFLTSGQSSTPTTETKQITNAAAGDYLLDVYDCANGCSDDEGTPGDYTLTVTVN